MSEEVLQIKKLTDAIHPLSSDDWEALSAIWHPFASPRKQVLTAQGHKEKYLYFVLDGMQRVYCSDDQERESTIVFTYPPSFGGVIDSFLLQQPSRYAYETLSPSRFLRAGFTDLDVLMKERPQIERMIRLGMAGALSGIMERLAELQCYSSEEKFRKLLARSPHILQLVPHKYLANYLGIDPTNFSKLLNTVRI